MNNLEKLKKFVELNKNRIWLTDDGGSLVWYPNGSNCGWYPYWAKDAPRDDSPNNPYRPHTYDFEFVDLLATILNGVGTPDFLEALKEVNK